MPATDFMSTGQVRNGSEFPVPNGSKFGGGRPAVMSDEQLLTLAGNLNDRLGRPPRADELIAESGGCQRKRALAAIRQLRLTLAQRAVQTQLVFPATVESSLRASMAQWLEHAAQQLASHHLEITERLDTRQATQLALIEELQLAVETHKQQLGDRERMVNEFRRRIHELESDLTAAREQCQYAHSIAEERLRLLNRFEAVVTGRSDAPARSESSAGGGA